MAVQIISILILYFIGTLPADIGELLHIFKISSHGEEESAVQEEIFLYLISLITPCICLMSLPEIYTKIPFLPCLRLIVNARFNVVFSTRQNQVGIADLNTRRLTIKPI
ncbi:unnamed protein product [Adineta steineri]|uniref:Uncharacterized protein n=1 Tax=Adineta steineri TaxID=433720 RepID=A0A815BRZ4_9BILA|nr:unnamed protein product [Adineta steineri]CAF1252873.1 unnamed protein product [Adineta steineri]CAF1277307.1 unnamed protein product [Adineta steineri]